MKLRLLDLNFLLWTSGIIIFFVFMCTHSISNDCLWWLLKSVLLLLSRCFQNYECFDWKLFLLFLFSLFSTRPEVTNIRETLVSIWFPSRPDLANCHHQTSHSGRTALWRHQSFGLCHVTSKDDVTQSQVLLMSSASIVVNLLQPFCFMTLCLIYLYTFNFIFINLY